MEIDLLPLDRQFLPAISSNRVNKELIDSLGTSFRYLPSDKDEDWYKSVIESTTQERAIIVPRVRKDTAIGMVSLTNINWINRTAEFHIQLYSNYREGIGSKVTRAFLTHAFENLNLNRVYLFVHEKNESAIKMYQKVGFLLEGVLRESLFKNGKFLNQFLFAMTLEDYNTLKLHPNWIV